MRKLIVNTLVEELKEDLATRGEATQLQGKLTEATEQLSKLSIAHKDIETKYRELEKENEKLTKKVDEQKEDLRKYEKRLLEDPQAKPPEDKGLPLRLFR